MASSSRELAARRATCRPPRAPQARACEGRRLRTTARPLLLRGASLRPLSETKPVTGHASPSPPTAPLTNRAHGGGGRARGARHAVRRCARVVEPPAASPARLHWILAGRDPSLARDTYAPGGHGLRAPRVAVKEAPWVWPARDARALESAHARSHGGIGVSPRWFAIDVAFPRSPLTRGLRTPERLEGTALRRPGPSVADAARPSGVLPRSLGFEGGSDA